MRRRLHVRGWSRFAALMAAVAMTSGLAFAAAKTMSANSGDASPAAETAAKPAAEKLDINAASKAELSKLPGIGDAYSQKIIDGRPYKSKSELQSKKILPKGVYDKIAPLIIAHQK